MVETYTLSPYAMVETYTLSPYAMVETCRMYTMYKWFWQQIPLFNIKTTIIMVSLFFLILSFDFRYLSQFSNLTNQANLTGTVIYET